MKYNVKHLVPGPISSCMTGLLATLVLLAQPLAALAETAGTHAAPEDSPFEMPSGGPLVDEGQPSRLISHKKAMESLTVLPQTDGIWKVQGPGPSNNGQAENILPDNQVVGAVHALAAHPVNPDVLYLGAVNGGVWKTLNATDTSPDWTPLTDDLPSLSIGSLEFDPMDASHSTLWAGIGRFSSFSSKGGLRTGLLVTTDGGASWTTVDGSGALAGKNISGLAPRGDTLVVSVNYADSFTLSNVGVFRSIDGGASFSQMSQGDGTAAGLPGGIAYDLASNRNVPSVLYVPMIYADTAGGANGIYRSVDTGATWAKVSSAAMDALLISGTTSNVEISVGDTGVTSVAIINSGQLRNGGIFQSPTGVAGTWNAMDVPLVNETGGSVGTNPRYKPDAGVPGGQGAIHFSILADQVDSTVLYVGGDRQPAGYGDLYGFPNALGANDYSGRLFRGNSSVTSTGGVPSPQWKHLTHTIDAGGMTGGGTMNNTSPHADSREMVFDANGDIIECDDGGVYRRTSPGTNAGDWFSVIGNLQVTEQHDVAYDTLSNIIISGNQDTGTTQQSSVGSKTWDSVSTADGGDVAVSRDPDDPARSVRYSSFQYMGGFIKRTYDSSGSLVSQSYPLLNVVSGDSPSPSFVTPVEINQVDATRLLFGGSNGLYESFDQGDTLTQLISDGINWRDGGNMMVYGGRHLGGDIPGVIYAATSDKVVIRQIVAGPISTATVASSGDSVRGVIADPENFHTVVAIDSDQVFMSTDAGLNWTDITGNLATAFVSIDLHSLEFFSSGGDRAVLVGTNQGVYVALSADYTKWSKVGGGLPNVPLWDMVYDVEDDLLVVGTLGRGAWTLSSLSRQLYPSSNGLCFPVKDRVGGVSLICL